MPFLSTTEMNTFTHRNIRRTAVDQILKSATLLAIFRAKSRLILQDGGSITAQPLFVQLNGTAMTYQGMDVLETSTQEEFTNYEIDWKEATSACVISNRDKRKNQGVNQQFDLLKARQHSALLALINKMAAQAYADGTGNAGKDWDGVGASIQNASGYQVYLGIDRVANPWWQAQVFDPGVPTPLSTGNMFALFSACRTDTEVIDLITTNKAAYNIYMSLLTPGERYVDDFVGGLGFDNIAFMGKPIVEDSNSDASTMIFHNLDHERLFVHQDENFRFLGFEKPVNQNGEIGRWNLMGNFENRKPSATGRYKNILNA